MADPAVEAARRAWPTKPVWFWAEEEAGVRSVIAAREALAPVRELVEGFVEFHRPFAEHSGSPFSQGVMHAMRDIAQLIYTSEELEAL